MPVSGYIAQMLDFGKDVDHMVRSTIELMSKLQGYVSGAIEHITIVMERKK